MKNLMELGKIHEDLMVLLNEENKDKLEYETVRNTDIFITT